MAWNRFEQQIRIRGAYLNFVRGNISALGHISRCFRELADIALCSKKKKNRLLLKSLGRWPNGCRNATCCIFALETILDVPSFPEPGSENIGYPWQHKNES